MGKTRILIADDDAIVREGVRALLGLADDLQVVGEAADGRQAIDLASSLDPDVILMDVAMPGLGGMEATLEIRKQVPGARINRTMQNFSMTHLRNCCNFKIRAPAAANNREPARFCTEQCPGLLGEIPEAPPKNTRGVLLRFSPGIPGATSSRHAKGRSG